MREREWMSEEFEANRAHLRAVAYRMLGSLSEAEDAVQESWLRLSRADRSEVENIKAWLTTVVARLCLDMLRARKSRREETLEEYAQGVGTWPGSGNGSDPEDEALMADSVGLALMVVLDTLNPPERLAFVLHDIFAMPFGEIAPIVGRSLTATRQLASRGRRRVRGAKVGAEKETQSAGEAGAEGDAVLQRRVVDAFLSAARGGEFGALLAMLDPDVVLRADDAAVRMGATREVRGASAVAETFSGRAQFAEPAIVDGEVGAVWAPGGKARVAFGFRIVGERIVEIELISDAERLSRVELVVGE
jgi:RNA polymerase sigma-70 factor (ECF subfamily)